jgi:hypothetical protein
VAGLTQVEFPVGGTPPALPYPEVHQLTDEYAALGFLFSDDDGGLPAAFGKFTQEPLTYNVVRQSTLGNVYRLDFTGGDVRQVRLVLRDSNLSDTIHRLAAFSATGALLSTAEHRDWLSPVEFPFLLSVSSPSTPIASVVFTQLWWTGSPYLFATALTCLEFGTPSSMNTATPTSSPTPTATPGGESTAVPTATQTPGPQCLPVIVSANADAWFEQSSTANKGDDSNLKVQSKSGNDNFRAIVGFPLPLIPPGCELDAAELRLYAESAKPGRIIQVQRAATAWGEMSVHWQNQPTRTGPISTVASGSTKGWRHWTVTEQVAGMYDDGSTHGFVISDQVEGEDSEQTYRSRESGSNVPALALHFRVSTNAPPPATATSPPPPTATATVADTATIAPPPTMTAVPATSTAVPATSTVVPATSTAAPATSTAAPATSTVVATNAATSTRTRTPTRTSTVTRTATRTRTPTTVIAATATSPPGSACTTVTLTAVADAWFEQSSSANKGDDSSLKVQSKSGNDAFRAIVRFALPQVPAGCTVGTAELRLYADSPKPGRVIQVQRAAAAWDEMSVNWPNQPPRVGSVSSVDSGSNPGWRTWTVTAQVGEMYAAGVAHGFVIFDQIETQDSEQTYRSRESGSNRPTLIITYEPH